MSHKCHIEGSSVVCFERQDELWIKEYSDGHRPEGRTYKVNVCPECGFKLPKNSFSKKFFGSLNIPDSAPDDEITQFSQSLSNAIADMNHNIALIKSYIHSQNIQNELFLEKDLISSTEIQYLKRRIEILEGK